MLLTYCHCFRYLNVINRSGRKRKLKQIFKIHNFHKLLKILPDFEKSNPEAISR